MSKTSSPPSPRKRKISFIGKTSKQKEEEEDKKRKLLMSALEDDTPEEVVRTI
jgi:hypothetical protein